MGAQRAFAPSSLFCRVNSRVKIKERVFFLINLDSVSHEDSTNSKFKTFSQINKIVKVKYHMNIQIHCCPFLFFGFEMVLHLHQMIEWAWFFFCFFFILIQKKFGSARTLPTAGCVGSLSGKDSSAPTVQIGCTPSCRKSPCSLLTSRLGVPALTANENPCQSSKTVPSSYARLMILNFFLHSNRGLYCPPFLPTPAPFQVNAGVFGCIERVNVFPIVQQLQLQTVETCHENRLLWLSLRCCNHVWSFPCLIIKESSDIPPNLPTVRGINDCNTNHAAISATI